MPNHEFYARVFELILRLKGNLLWPAMWGRAFADDDAQSPVLADEYGVVIGTSHHEPMMRAHVEWQRYGKGPWNYEQNRDELRAFWRRGIERMDGHESIVTLGMRGDGDEPMTQGTAIDLLERIVADQRGMLAEITGRPAERTPQVWALYKEVQDYFDAGMRVPDDVTLAVLRRQLGQPAPAAEGRRQTHRRLRHLLSLRLRRRPAQLQVDQHEPDRARLGADAARARLRRRPPVDRQCRRHQADGIPDLVLPRSGVEVPRR